MSIMSGHYEFWEPYEGFWDQFNVPGYVTNWSELVQWAISQGLPTNEQEWYEWMGRGNGDGNGDGTGNGGGDIVPNGNGYEEDPYDDIWDDVGDDLKDLLGKLIGNLPSGGYYDKFLRNVYPVMLAKARATGRDTHCFWYGGNVVVHPSGEWGEVDNPQSIAAWEAWGTERGKLFNFYFLYCWDYPNMGTCTWKEFGPGKPGPSPTPTPTPETTISGMSTTAALIIGASLIGVAAIVMMGGGKK